jgi:hypothetical protein
MEENLRKSLSNLFLLASFQRLRKKTIEKEKLLLQRSLMMSAKQTKEKVEFQELEC